MVIAIRHTAKFFQLFSNAEGKVECHHCGSGCSGWRPWNLDFSDYEPDPSSENVVGSRAGLNVISLRVSGFSFCSRFLGRKSHDKIAESEDICY